MSNVFTVFAPGGGGHHVANLLSTDSKIIDRFDMDYYRNSSDNLFHCENFDNEQLKPKNIDLEKMLKGSRAHACHFFEWESFVFAKLLKDRKFIMITLPNYGSRGHHRMCDMNEAYKEEYFYYEMKALYTNKNFKKVFDLQEQCLQINGNDVFSSGKFIDSLTAQAKTIGIDLDKDKCAEAHSLWLSKL